MGLWSWLFGSRAAPRPPDWSTFTDEAAFARFVEGVRAALAERGHEVEPRMLRSGSVMLDVRETRREWILHKLAERCAGTPETQWEEKIGATLDRFLKNMAFDEDMPPEPKAGKKRKRKKKGAAEDLVLRSSPEITPADLRLQIMSSTYVSVLDRATSIRRPLAPGLEQVLVAVFAGSEITLGPGDLARLGLDEEAAWTLASDNAVASDLKSIVTNDFPVEGGGTLSLLVSNDFFMGACVLRLLEQVEEDVTLVTLLTWHHAVIYVADEPPSLATVTLLADVVAKLERDVAVATAEWLSPALYRYRRSDRSFTELGIARDDAGNVVGIMPEIVGRAADPEGST